MITTTNLNEITFGQGSNFTWGEAIKKHSIGEYDIIEYYPHEFKNGYTTGKIDYTQLHYSCYINQSAIGYSGLSLDEALVICIAYKRDGVNSQAAHFFMKMIERKKDGE